MRTAWIMTFALSVPGFLAANACGNENSPEPVQSAPGAGTGGTGGTGGDDGAVSEEPDAEPQVSPTAIEIGEPERMVAGAARLVELTTDDHAIYRLGSTLYAAKLERDAQPTAIVDNATIVQVHGRVAFAWTNIDYTTSLADLVVWTAAHGPQVVGSTFFREGTVAASEDGERVLYLTNPTVDRVDLMIADTALLSKAALVPAVGRGSNTTCAPRFGFEGGDKVVVGYCQPESWDATLDLLTPDPASGFFQTSTLATDGESNWSADALAQRIFFTTRSSRANVFEAGQLQMIDTRVGWGVLTPDGATAFYVVGDQLRRTSLANIDPVPIIPNDFRSRVAFDPSFSYVLFSKQVSYEAGTRRDLYLSPTTVYNPTPEMLVAEPVASVSLSAFTDDGSHALWLTDLDAQGSGTLHARRVWGGTELLLEHADTAVAAGGAVVVFSDGRSAPTEDPIVAELKIVDLALDVPAAVLRSRIVDGRTFAVSEDKTRVVYSLPADENAADVQGMYVQRFLAP